MKRRRVWYALAAAVFLTAAAFVSTPPLLDGVSFSRAVYDRNGHLLRLTLSKDQTYRHRVPLSRISPKLVEATLLHEDRYFRWHPGVNPVALIRAALQTYVTGGRRVGASTITMQVARMRYSINTRSVVGKLYQIFKAVQLEAHHSKDAILEAYLNLAPYGRNVEGAGAASLVFLKKAPGSLTLREALTLSVIPQSPTLRSPATISDAANPDLVAARGALLRKWLARHPEEKADTALFNLPMAVHAPSEMPFGAPHFVEAMLKGNPDAAELMTTLDLRLQKIVERRIASYIEHNKRMGINNAAALLVDFRSMDVLAEVGSADYLNDAIQGQVNGVRAKRSPASTLKPIIYALGIDQGIIHPMSLLKDAPASFGSYNPENSDRGFTGVVNATDALIRSRNLPALHISRQLDNPSLYQFLVSAGVTGLKDERHYGLALTLGGAEMTMEEIVRLYAMLANNGVLRGLHTVIKEPLLPGTGLLSPEAAFLSLDMLSHNQRPHQDFRGEITAENLTVHWKSGTSYSFRDAWSVAVFGQYVLAVWIGNFDGESNPAFTGTTAAAPLLFGIIDAIKPQGFVRQTVFPPESENLRKVKVCAVSGRIPGPYCRHTAETWFISGKSPIKTCEIHREILVDARTGLRACNAQSKGVKKAVYEFWPSDLQKIFRQAGMPRKTPPAHMPECGMEGKDSRGQPPKITSPIRGVVYNMRASAPKARMIPFSAVTDADVEHVFWFLDERYLGKTRRNEPLQWLPEPGIFVVRAVDDSGRSDSRALKVMVVE